MAGNTYFHDLMVNAKTFIEGKTETEIAEFNSMECNKRPVEILLSNRESAREDWWGTSTRPKEGGGHGCRGTPPLFSRGGSLLPSIYADARYIY